MSRFLVWTILLLLLLPVTGNSRENNELLQIRKFIKNGEDFVALEKVKEAQKKYPESTALHYLKRKLNKKLNPDIYKSNKKGNFAQNRPVKKRKKKKRDRTGPLIVNQTSAWQQLSKNQALAVKAKISDPSGLKKAFIRTSANPDQYCQQLPLRVSAKNIYSGNIPLWCSGQGKKISYQIVAIDRRNNRTILGEKTPLTATVKRPFSTWEWLVMICLPGSLILLIAIPLLHRKRRKLKKKDILQEIANVRQQQQEPEQELEIIETLDPETLSEVEDRREKKFFERRRKMFNIGKKNKKK